MTIKDPELRAHQEWLGYVQPVGLVVSAHALHRAQAFVAKGILPEHARFLSLVKEVPVEGKDEPLRAITDLDALVTTVFGWESRDLVGALGGEPIPDDLKVPLNEYGETLSPTYAVADPEPQGEGTARWQMLIQKMELAKPLDEPLTKDDLRWQASPQARLERLLRETGVSAGLLTNGIEFRLVYAPRGESSGHATFRVDQMCEIAGRPIFAALQMLLGAERLFTLPRKQRLPYILSESRKYQNVVSTALAEQVLHALYEMLRGFQRANDESKGELLRDVLREDPNHVYNGLLTVLLRLIFVLYAEERGLLSSDPVYVNHYSVLGLFERLRADSDRNQDTMDHRYGAWAQLLTLFRLIHDGGSHGSLRLPPRHGHLFNPDRFNFLEGRLWRIGRVMGDRIESPAISDGVIHRVLSKLLLLDGERISYRSLDVEQIGSVYEVMMGFTLDIASGICIAIKPKKPLGAPTIVNLDELVAIAPKERAKWLRERTDQEFTGEALAALAKASTVDDLAVSLAKRIAREASPAPLPKGSIILQSSESRRRSGSNYTPRSLTEPIVRKTLEPILRDFGGASRPDQILALKVCDPAMGSGAFLVETCRQLGDELVKSWHMHAQLPRIPPDEDEVLHARRLVAQRCLYGVDKNPIAADLAKLSLWLATLAKDHPFTFLDHALRCGDSLVGLNREQIEGFHWKPSKQLELVRSTIAVRLAEAVELRAQIQAGCDDLGYDERRILLMEADEALDDVRLVGNLVICALCDSETPPEREADRVQLAAGVDGYLAAGTGFNELRSRVEALGEGEQGLRPFHWDIEYPEVFEHPRCGFDVIVGNPPYAGNRTLTEAAGTAYSKALRVLYEGAAGRTDLVAFFVRQAYRLSRKSGAVGFLATNTVAQGDTRRSGLAYVCGEGARIYAAQRRADWTGTAAVVPSIVWFDHGVHAGAAILDGREVEAICPYLVPGVVIEPRVLRANTGYAFLGCKPGHRGFVVDAAEAKALADTIEPGSLLEYVGGVELYDAPDLKSPRRVFALGLMEEAELPRYPKASAALRLRLGGGDGKHWWRFAHAAKSMLQRSKGLDRVLVKAEVSSTYALAFKPTAHSVFSNKAIVICLDDWASFAVLQSRVHEEWARLTSGTMKDDLSYVPGDSFDTFPFPVDWRQQADIVAAGERYAQWREKVMLERNEGLTALYSRFHDPNEQSSAIAKLRVLHGAMDRAVLCAYGPSLRDIPTVCQYIPDYVEEDDEGHDVQKSIRLRWPDVVRDEVLARLLTLNSEREQQERMLAAQAEPPAYPRRPPRKKGAGPSASLYPD
ncbi:MAG: N-6 DNA methylase [Planctomycetes bacterium]|nr:N-6 DNA methylase [Planctomycetota bacterium]